MRLSGAALSPHSQTTAAALQLKPPTGPSGDSALRDGAEDQPCRRASPQEEGNSSTATSYRQTVFGRSRSPHKGLSGLLTFRPHFKPRSIDNCARRHSAPRQSKHKQSKHNEISAGPEEHRRESPGSERSDTSRSFE
ncbi:hypothetical protein MHYP_G00311620 [Metynnis hypsauchen]